MLIRRSLTIALSRSFASLAAFAILTGTAAAQSVSFANIVSTGVTAPNGSAFTALGNFPAMDGSTAAFQATAGGIQGIYTGTGGALGTLVAPSSAIPNGTGNFTAINLSFRYDSGNAVFIGSGTSPTQSGVYTSNGSTITRIADLNTAIPGGAGNFTGFSPAPSYSGGAISFIGAGSNPTQSGVFSTASGSLSALANLGTISPDGSAFTGFGANPSLSGTTTVFRASTANIPSLGGVYASTAAGAITTVASTAMTIPGGSSNFTGPFSEPSISGGNVAFIAGNGVYARINGTLTTIANTSTPSPNGTGNFTAITTYAPISGSNVAFIGSTATSKGIYLYTGGQLVTLLDNTTGTFDGKTLATTPFFLGLDAISGNQVAFDVSFTSPTSSGIYVATFTPAPEPTLLLFAGMALTALPRVFRRTPRLAV